MRRRRVASPEARALRDDLQETVKVLVDTSAKIEEFARLIEEIASDDGS